MTIVFICRRFYPLIGGVEKHVLEISKILISLGHSVTVITENYQSMPLTAKFKGINIIRVNAGKEDFFKKFRVWHGLSKHSKIIQSADVIHCHDIFFWYLPFKFIFPNKKVFTTFHGYEGNHIPNWKSKFMHKLSEKLSNGNICIGNFYKKWYGTNATIISFGAVDKKLIEQGRNNIKAKNMAMFLGRLEEETGFMEYIKALRKLNINLDVFGAGSQENEAKKYAKSNNLKISFKGFIDNATDYIKDYEYIFTSRYLGILEAMAMGKIIFANYNNSIKKDYLYKTPFKDFIYISKNSEELVMQFKYHLKNNSQEKIKKELNWITDKTWDNLTKIYLNLWNKNI